MPASETWTSLSIARRAAAILASRLSGIGEAVSDLVARLVKGLAPAPALQPIPVRVRRQHRR